VCADCSPREFSGRVSKVYCVGEVVCLFSAVPCNRGIWEANSRLIIMLIRSSNWKKVAAFLPGKVFFTRGTYFERN